MCSLILFLFAVIYTESVYSSVHHGAIALPVVLHKGYLADTHEVAAAKSAHLSALSSSQLSHGYSGHYGYGGSSAAHGDYRYHGPIAIPHVLHDGHIADTHEVAAAKADHFAAVAKAKAHGGYNSHNEYDGSYGAHAGYNSYNGYGGSYEAYGDYRYHGPIAIPYVLHDGHIADTHEVAAAKAEHFAAVANAKTHGHVYSGHYAGAYRHHVAAYHGLLAKPVVLPSGYLADTHEVAAAKNHHLHLLTSSHSSHH